MRDAKQEVDDIIKKVKNLPDDYKYENHDSRCWGFFRSKKKAIQAVTENWTDMNKAAYYRYAVIEPHYEGLINPIIGEEMWFKAKYKEREDKRGTYKALDTYHRSTVVCTPEERAAAEGTSSSGIASTHIEDGGISRCTLYSNYKNTPEDFQAYLGRELMGNAARYAFWITFIILGLAGVILFCYLDNDWLNEL